MSRNELLFRRAAQNRIAMTVPLLTALATTVGCAFTAMPLTLPTDTPSLRLGLGKGREIVVTTFTDDRTIQDRCGMKKNGYNMDTADAVCGSEPTQWITDLLARGLSESGFSVAEPDASHGDGALVIEGSLRKLFVEPVIGAWTGSLEADIQIELVASTGTGLMARRTFFSKGVRGGQMLATSGPYQLALRRATGEIVRNMVEAIGELANDYPSIGKNGSAWTRVAIVEEAR